MNLSVILIGCNSLHYLKPNLASLAFLYHDETVEIIYVDNASKDGTQDYILQHYPKIRMIENRRNRGVSAARNQGIREATGKYVWLLDSDTEVNPAAVVAMQQLLDTHPDVALCGCKMYGTDGEVQDSCRHFPSLTGKLSAGLQIIAVKFDLPIPHPDAHYDKFAPQPFAVDYVIGACQMFRRSIIEKVGLLDEKIFYGPEDADFCLRIRQAGYKVYYLPQVSIFHAYRRVSSHHIFSRLTFKHIQGLIYYFMKHRAIGRGKTCLFLW